LNAVINGFNDDNRISVITVLNVNNPRMMWLPSLGEKINVRFFTFSCTNTMNRIDELTDKDRRICYINLSLAHY